MPFTMSRRRLATIIPAGGMAMAYHGVAAVDAPIQVLEAVAGVMQQPSDEIHVAWYKETARLGETGNFLLAGHLTWRGIPEAVFFTPRRTAARGLHRAPGRGGNRLHLRGGVGTAGIGPGAVGGGSLGMTAAEAVTLITGGGEWDSASSASVARTVVRADRLPGDAIPEA